MKPSIENLEDDNIILKTNLKKQRMRAKAKQEILEREVDFFCKKGKKIKIF